MSEKPRIKYTFPLTPLDKASSENTSSRVSHKEIGYSGLLMRNTLSNTLTYLEEEQIEDLQWPYCLDTFQAMRKDATVGVAIRAKNTLIVSSLQESKVVAGDPRDAASVQAAEFCDWCLQNLEDQSMFSVLQDICTYNTFGFSVLEKVYTRVRSGEYAGRVKLKKLAGRSQKSLDLSTPVSYTSDGRTFLGINQDRRNLPDYFSIPSNDPEGLNTLVRIPSNRLMMFSFEGFFNNALGRSPLVDIYATWKEKKLIEEYQVIGISKDLGGTPIIKIPIETLNKAAQDPSSQEARTVETLMRDIANMHAGEQSYVMLPSDVTESSNTPLFDLKFLGVDGGGKQFDLEAAINSRKQAILDSFGAGFISLGNNGTGSYAMMDGKTSVHEAFVNYDLKFITEVFNTQLFPQLLAINGIKLTQKQMPKLVPGDVSAENIDTVSKMIQRVFSVAAVPQTVEVTNEALEALGFSYRVPENTSQEELSNMLGEATSRAGDGMATPGEGTSTEVGGADSSVSNSENGGIEKSKLPDEIVCVNIKGR